MAFANSSRHCWRMGSPRFFSTPARFRAWLEKNHETARELWVGYHRTTAGVPSITWPNSVDEALCFGWIDGVRKTIDEARYMIRFTPRRPGSIWSNVNIAKMERLIAEGRVQPAGAAAYARRSEARSGIYEYEKESRDRLSTALDDTSIRVFKRAPAAWRFFESQAPYYRKLMTFWIMSAKRPVTRERRLAKLIEHSSRGERVP